MAAMTAAERKRQFLETLRPYARRFEQQTGIPAAWAMAMAANETGWDASNPVLFGIKGVSPSGKSRVFKTTEYYGKGPVTVEARFAVYDDPGEGFDHLAQEMATPRYRGAPRASAAAFARYLKDRGWATDPAYPGKITRLAGEIGNTTPVSGGWDMTEPEEDDYRAQTLRAIEDYIKTLETERTSLQGEWQTLQDKLARVDPMKDPTPPQLLAEQQRLRDALSQNATAMRSAQSTRAATARVLANSLDDQLKLRELRIREGAETRAQANDRWDRALESAKLGVSNILSGLGMVRQALPMAGDRKLATAVAQSVKNWNTLGGNVPTDWELPVYEFDPMSALGAYQPPAPDWQAAMKAAAAPGAGAEDEGAPPGAAAQKDRDYSRAAETTRLLQLAGGLGDYASTPQGAGGTGKAPAGAARAPVPPPAPRAPRLQPETWPPPAAGAGALPQLGPASDWPAGAPPPYAPSAAPGVPGSWAFPGSTEWAGIGAPAGTPAAGAAPRSASPETPAGRPTPGPTGGPTPGPTPREPAIPQQQEGESDEEYLKRVDDAVSSERAKPESFLRLDPADPRYQAIVAGDSGLEDLLALLRDYAPRGVGA